MNELKDTWYKLTRSAYTDYITFVNGNENDTIKLAEKKLNRNLRSGQYVSTRRNNIIIVGYGGLRIGLRDDCIIFVENRVKPFIEINREMKDKLDIEYGLKVKEVKEDIKVDYEGVSFFHKIMKIVGLHN